VIQPRAEETLRAINASGFKVGGMRLVAVSEGRSVVHVTTTAEHTNLFGRVHGCVAATLVDDVGTIAIAASDREGRPGVSVDLNVTWLTECPVAADLIVTADVLRAGRTMAFVSVRIEDNDGRLMAVGRMSKALR